MGTKSHWRKGKLRFYNAPMFTSVTAITTNVPMRDNAGDKVTIEQVLVEGPMYAGTFTTEGDMHFEAVAGGILSSSESVITFKLNWGGATAIVALGLLDDATGPSEDYKAFHVEFNGRIVGLHASSGQIAATGRVTCGFSTIRTAFAGTTGSTGVGVKFASSNLALTVDATAGLNISADFASTGGVGAGTTNLLYCTYGYIKYYS